MPLSMAHAPGQRTDSTKCPRDGGVIAAVGRFLGFAIVAGVAMAILAAVVLLPAWQRMRTAQIERDQLSATAQANDRVIRLRASEVEALKTDPLQTRRILIESRNYRVPGESSITVAGGQTDECVRDLLASAPTVKEIDPSLNNAAMRVQITSVRNLLLITAGLLLTLAAAVFIPTTH